MRRFAPVLASPLSVQLGLVLIGLLLMAFAPPVRGAMLLLPLRPLSEARLLNLASANGARLVQAGPLPNSLVVEGVSAKLAPAMLSHGVLLLSGAQSGCAPPTKR